MVITIIPKKGKFLGYLILKFSKANHENLK